MLSVKLGKHMQLTYQDMLKNFEKTYRYYNYPDSAYIEEEFNLSKYLTSKSPKNDKLRLSIQKSIIFFY